MSVRCALPSAFAIPALHRLGNHPYAFWKRTSRVPVPSIAHMFDHLNHLISLLSGPARGTEHQVARLPRERQEIYGSERVVGARSIPFCSRTPQAGAHPGSSARIIFY